MSNPLKTHILSVGKIEGSISHVNPNCKSSRFCKPHGETGTVDYDISLVGIFSIAQAREQNEVILSMIEGMKKDTHPMEDGVPVETYGYEETHNAALDAMLVFLLESGLITLVDKK